MSDNTISIKAHKKKTGTPYSISVGSKHIAVLETLRDVPYISDQELSILIGNHNAGARRCELRDAGLVEQYARNVYGMTWMLSRAGHRFLEEQATFEGQQVAA